MKRLVPYVTSIFYLPVPGACDHYADDLWNADTVTAYTFVE